MCTSHPHTSHRTRALRAWALTARCTSASRPPTRTSLTSPPHQTPSEKRRAPWPHAGRGHEIRSGVPGGWEGMRHANAGRHLVDNGAEQSGMAARQLACCTWVGRHEAHQWVRCSGGSGVRRRSATQSPCSTMPSPCCAAHAWPWAAAGSWPPSRSWLDSCRASHFPPPLPFVQALPHHPWIALPKHQPGACYGCNNRQCMGPGMDARSLCKPLHIRPTCSPLVSVWWCHAHNHNVATLPSAPSLASCPPPPRSCACFSLCLHPLPCAKLPPMLTPPPNPCDPPPFHPMRATVDFLSL